MVIWLCQWHNRLELIEKSVEPDIWPEKMNSSQCAFFISHTLVNNMVNGNLFDYSEHASAASSSGVIKLYFFFFFFFLVSAEMRSCFVSDLRIRLNQNFLEWSPLKYGSQNQKKKKTPALTWQGTASAIKLCVQILLFLRDHISHTVRFHLFASLAISVRVNFS